MAKYTKYKKHPISKLELLRMKHRALRMKKYAPMTRMAPGLAISQGIIWNAPMVHSFSRSMSPTHRRHEATESFAREQQEKEHRAPKIKGFPGLRMGAAISIPQRTSTSLWTSHIKPAASMWGDKDRDGVMNGFDCQPRNKKKQGPEHEDQLGWEGGEGERQASRNITKITKNNFERKIDYDNARVQMMNDYVEDAPTMKRSIETFKKASDSYHVPDRDNDQIGFDDETASKNITDITKRYKNKPF
jgi:hypothetical protein